MPSQTTKRLPASVWKPIRLYILARDNYTCSQCHRKLTTHDKRLKSHATVDHKIPLCLGGTDQEANLIAKCMECNSRKGQLERRIKEINNGTNSACNSGVDLRTSREW